MCNYIFISIYNNNKESNIFDLFFSMNLKHFSILLMMIQLNQIMKILTLLRKENEEYKNKISNLEKYIKELETKIKEKENIIKDEKIKYDILNNKIKVLENNSNNYSLNDRILELENELNKFKSYCLLPGEKLIEVKFISTDQNINNHIGIAKNTEKFTKLEEILYEKYPKYKDTENYFIVNGQKINRNRTLDENKIKNNDVITLSINDLD